MSSPTKAGSPIRAWSLRAALAHVAAAAAIVVARPIFDVTAGSPEFFVAHRLTPLDVAAVALAVPFGPVLLVAVATLLLRPVAPALARGLVAAVIGLLAGLFAVQLLARLDASVTWLAAGALVSAVVVGLAYVRAPVARFFFTALTPAIIVVPALFVVSPSVQRLLARPRHPPVMQAVSTSEAPVVVVVFDQLPLTSLLDASGRIDAVRYPAFGALADDAIWFRQTTSVSDRTEWAVPALVTGRLPSPQRLPRASDYPENLFTLFGPTRDVHVREPLTALCPLDLCPDTSNGHLRRIGWTLSDLGIIYGHVILPPDVAAALPPVTQTWAGFGGDRFQALWAAQRDTDRAVDVRAWIDGIRRTSRPSLQFIHILLPHEPYVYVPTGQRIADSETIPGLAPGEVWTTDIWPVVQSYQRHLLQVGFADRLLGEIVDRLKTEGIYDDALLVVAADHGASFRPGRNFKVPSPDTLVDIAPVPFFLKLPGRHAGRIEDTPAETVDVLPTLAAALDVHITWRIDGRSRLTSVGARDRSIRYERGRQRIDLPAPPVMWQQTMAAVARKIDWFGAGADPIRPRVGAGLDALYDRSVNDVPTGTAADLEVTLRGAALYADIDPTRPFVPALVQGTLVERAGHDPIVLAVAVDGVVRGLTRVGATPAGTRRAWQVVVPVEDFAPGHNSVEAFVVVDRSGTAALMRPGTGALVPATGVRPGNLVIRAVQASMGATESGFYPIEQAPDGEFRWTNGHGHVTVPFDPANPPASITIAAGSGGGGPRTATLRVGACDVFSGVIPRGLWEASFPLAGCVPAAPPIEIDLESGTFMVPPDPRPLGIAVRRLVLGPAASPAEGARVR